MSNSDFGAQIPRIISETHEFKVLILQYETSTIHQSEKNPSSITINQSQSPIYSSTNRDSHWVATTSKDLAAKARINNQSTDTKEQERQHSDHLDANQKGLQSDKRMIGFGGRLTSASLPYYAKKMMLRRSGCSFRVQGEIRWELPGSVRPDSPNAGSFMGLSSL